MGPCITTGKIKRETKRGKKTDRERASRKVRRRDSISRYKVFRVTAGKGKTRKDGKKDDANARRKTNGAREESGFG